MGERVGRLVSRLLENAPNENAAVQVLLSECVIGLGVGS